MINQKQKILEIVNNLPEDVTWDDAMYALYIRSKLEKSKESIKNGNTITIEELKKFIDGLEARYEADNTQ